MSEVVELDTEFLDDPYRMFTRLREQAPVCVAELSGGERFWLVTRYDDVRAALTDPAIGKDAAGLMQLQGLDGPVGKSMQTHMLNSDPPDHTRLRKLISTVFTGRAVERLRPRIAEIADELIAGIAACEQIDLLAEFAYPLPLTVICELLGVATDDRDGFRRWSHAISGSTGSYRDMRDAVVSMRAYLVSSIEQKRARPRADLLSELVHARDGSDALSENELVSTAFLLLFAGHETTVNLIANGTLALLRNSEQLAALRTDRSLISGAIEEFLRYESPVNLTSSRFTKRATRIGGVDIPAGEFVTVALGSANRDAERFADPDAVEISRHTAGHVAFGHGMHYCLGAPLARLEGEIAFDRLLTAFPDLALAVQPEELVWRESAHIRGLTTLPVRLRPMPAAPHRLDSETR